MGGVDRLDVEDASYRVLIQARDFTAGSGFVDAMHQAAQSAPQMVAVLSAAYLTSAYVTAEWQAAWKADLLGRERKLLSFRIEDCERPDLLGQVVTVDLFGLDRATPIELVVAAARSERGKPTVEPEFSGHPRPAGRPGCGRRPGWVGGDGRGAGRLRSGEIWPLRDPARTARNVAG